MSEEVSRRRLFGWLAAAAIAVTAPALIVSEPAEAQTVGMDRRQDRRARVGGRVGRYGVQAALPHGPPGAQFVAARCNRLTDEAASVGGLVALEWQHRAVIAGG